MGLFKKTAKVAKNAIMEVYHSLISGTYKLERIDIRDGDTKELESSIFVDEDGDWYQRFDGEDDDDVEYLDMSFDYELVINAKEGEIIFYGFGDLKNGTVLHFIPNKITDDEVVGTILEESGMAVFIHYNGILILVCEDEEENKGIFYVMKRIR